MSCEIFNWFWHAFRVWFSRSNRRYYDRLCRNLLNRIGTICIRTYGMRTVWNSERHAGQNCSGMREPQWLAKQFKQADECRLKRAYRHNIPVFFKSVFDRSLYEPRLYNIWKETVFVIAIFRKVNYPARVNHNIFRIDRYELFVITKKNIIWKEILSLYSYCSLFLSLSLSLSR